MGQILMTGGTQTLNGVPNVALNDVNTFEQRLTASPLTMLRGHWYLTLITLPNGDQLVHGGRDDTTARRPVLEPEV